MPSDLVDLLDRGGTRDIAYVVVAVVALAMYWHERRRRASLPDDSSLHDALWPVYWLLSAAVMLALAAGRGGLGDALTEFGRDQARSAQWYETRRTYQVVAVGVVAVTYVVWVAVAVWRVPPRRRRYLPNAVVIATIMALAAVRMVSLHQIDSLLYRTDIAGIRIIAIAELSLLFVAAASIVGLAVRDRRADHVSPAGATAD